MSAEAELTTWQGRASGLLGLLGMHPWAAHGWRQLAAHLMRLDTPAVANRVPSLSNSREEMMLLDWRREGRGTSATSCSGQGRWGVVGEGEEGFGEELQQVAAAAGREGGAGAALAQAQAQLRPGLIYSLEHRRDGVQGRAGPSHPP